MRNLDEHNITAEVLRRIADTPDARLHQIMRSLIQHLHDFAREVKLTEAEWFAGIEYLMETGQMCNEVRQEFVLLSDTLGLSQLVVAQSHSRAAGMTEQTVFGPFHVEGVPTLIEPGSDIARGTQGEALYVSARVSSGVVVCAKALVPKTRPSAVTATEVSSFMVSLQKSWEKVDASTHTILII